MPVHRNHARAVPAAGIIADEVAVVVLRCLKTDSVFQLRHYGDSAEELAAVGLWAANAFRSDHIQGRRETSEGEGMFTGSTAEGERSAVFKADAIWDLALQGIDLCGLV